MGGNYNSGWDNNDFVDYATPNESASRWLISQLKSTIVKMGLGFACLAVVLLAIDRIPDAGAQTVTSALESSIQAGTANGPVTSFSDEASTTSELSIVPQFGSGTTTNMPVTSNSTIPQLTTTTAAPTTSPTNAAPTAAPPTTTPAFAVLDFIYRPGAIVSPEGVGIKTTKITGDASTVVIDLDLTCNAQTGVVEVWIKTDVEWELIRTGPCTDSINAKQSQNLTASTDYLVDVRFEDAAAPAGAYAKHLILSVTAKTK